MVTDRSLRTLMDEYAESHRHPVNVLVHWICVPVIFFCVVGFLGLVPGIPLWNAGVLRPDILVIAAVSVYYLRRSLTLWAGVSLFAAICLWISRWTVQQAPEQAWIVFTALFVLAWTGQFIGHRIEGRKPSFLKDVQFLLIGPAWLLVKVYRRMGIRY